MLRYNTGKPVVSMIPHTFYAAITSEMCIEYLDPRLITELVEVLEFGAKKYHRNNWRSGSNWTAVADSGLRHLLKYAAGEQTDGESGLSHLGHFACNLMFLIEFAVNEVGTDDRYPAPIKREVVDTDEPLECLLLCFTLWLDGGPITDLYECVWHLNQIYRSKD